MRVVVVGGTGVISTGVVKALLQYGHEVTVFNRGRTASRLPPGVRYLRGDRKDRAPFEAAMQAERFDVAIDMICFTAEDAESDLRAFRGVKQFIQTSTLATFGGPLAEEPSDETSPMLPNSDYGRNKVAADNVVLAAHLRGELPVTIFKPSYTWAPGMFICRQIHQDPRWIDRMRRGMPLLVAGGGSQLISLCHADDAGIAYAAAIGRTRCLGETYNLASPRHMTWCEYHERIAAALGHRITLVDAPADLLIKVWPGNTRQLALDTRWNRLYRVDKIQRDIPEFQPRITIEEGVPACVAWMDAQRWIQDARTDDTEDRIIAGIDRLWAELGAK